MGGVGPAGVGHGNNAHHQLIIANTFVIYASWREDLDEIQSDAVAVSIPRLKGIPATNGSGLGDRVANGKGILDVLCC